MQSFGWNALLYLAFFLARTLERLIRNIDIIKAIVCLICHLPIHDFRRNSRARRVCLLIPMQWPIHIYVYGQNGSCCT